MNGVKLGKNVVGLKMTNNFSWLMMAKLVKWLIMLDFTMLIPLVNACCMRHLSHEREKIINVWISNHPTYSR